MSEKYQYNVAPTEGEPDHEKEPDLSVPIIDVVRHGLTDYKELHNDNFDPTDEKYFHFDPTDPDFKLDAEHLDLTAEGIEQINETAAALLDAIDVENEIVFINSSPNYRAQSTALIIKKVLEDAGVTLFDEQAEVVRTTNSLRQMSIKEGLQGEWIKANNEYRGDNPDLHTMRPEAVHNLAAEHAGKELSDYMDEDYDQIRARFNRYLRHMTNIQRYFSDETKKALQDKRLRIISITHEEVADELVNDSFGLNRNLEKGQVIEIRPTSELTLDQEDQAEIEIFPITDSEESITNTVRRSITPATGERP